MGKAVCALLGLDATAMDMSTFRIAVAASGHLMEGAQVELASNAYSAYKECLSQTS